MNTQINSKDKMFILVEYSNVFYSSNESALMFKVQFFLLLPEIENDSLEQKKPRNPSYLHKRRYLAQSISLLKKMMRNCYEKKKKFYFHQKFSTQNTSFLSIEIECLCYDTRKFIFDIFFVDK
jgi:hypothetical protein